MAAIHLKTYGCSHNAADSERMAGLLAAAGHTIVADLEDAELVVINSCDVKDPAEKRFFHDLTAIRKPLVVAGCIPETRQADERLLGFSAVGVKSLGAIVDVVEATLRGETRRVFNPVLARAPCLRHNRVIAHIPVCVGCLGACAYCKTVQARGRLVSRPLPEILAEIAGAVEDGACEIRLTGEDLGPYGKDLGTSLPALLAAIAALPGSFMVRVGMANPQYVREYLDQLLDLFGEHPRRFYRFLHLPVQSGSDEVLAAMRRGHTSADFSVIVERCRARFPEMTIATDLIVGFPGETEEQFQATRSLLLATRPRIVNLTKFYARPGTLAAQLTPLPTKTLKRRSSALVAAYESYDPNEQLLGTRHEILFTAVEKGSLVGRTREYLQVLLQADASKHDPSGFVPALGTSTTVTVIRENKYYLVGKV